MMSTKSKPSWRRFNWNGTDYMICTIAEPEKKLPVFKPGKWSLLPDSRVSLYGHDAKSMKNFNLHFDMAEQCDTLDRSWFAETWFPVEKYVYQVSPVTPSQIQQTLTSNKDIAWATMSCRAASFGHTYPDTCFIRVKHVCQYLHHTLGYALRYVPIPPRSKHKLWVLGDASFAPTGEKSQQGLIVYHGTFPFLALTYSSYIECLAAPLDPVTIWVILSCSSFSLSSMSNSASMV